MAGSSSVVEDEEIRLGLVKLLGDENVVSAPETKAWAVDGRVPKAVVFPDSTEDVSGLLALANRNSLSVVPRGSGTKMDLGGLPRRVDLVLSLQNLNKVVEFEPEDLVVTAEAGMRLEELQAALAKKGLWLPLDPPYHRATTLGGMVSSNSSGPLRYHFGSCRDWLLGVRVVTASGEAVRFGGKVVKNVAAYDLKKLFVGSLGSLGVITELTFKLYPLPVAQRTFVALFNNVDDAAMFVTRTISSDLLPYAVEALSPEACGTVAAEARVPMPGNSYAVVLGFGDVEESVEKQVLTAQEMSRSAGAAGSTAPDEPKGRAVWDSIQDLPLLMQQTHPSWLALKASVPASEFLDCCKALELLSATKGIACVYSAHAGNGIINFYLRGRNEGGDGEYSVGVVREARDAVLAMGGTLTLERAPVELKEKVGVWGPARSDFQLMLALKESFDPKHVLSPGRLVGGI